TLAIAQELRGLLHVDRHGVMDLRADAALGEMRTQRVAPATGHADRVAVEDVAPTGRDLGCDDVGAGEELVVSDRDRLAARVPLVEVAELDAEDRGLDLVEPRVVADDRVVVAGRLAVLA